MNWRSVQNFIQNRIYFISWGIALVVVVLLLLGFFIVQKETTNKEAVQSLYEAQQDWESLTAEKKISRLEKVYQDYHGSRAAFEAMLTIAALHEESNALQKVIVAYQKALDIAPSILDKVFMQYALGITQERLGNYNLAIPYYDMALSNKKAKFLNGEILLGKARCYEKLKEYNRASAIYQTIQEEYKQQGYYGDVARILQSKLKSSSGSR